MPRTPSVMPKTPSVMPKTPSATSYLPLCSTPLAKRRRGLLTIKVRKALRKSPATP